MKLFKATAATLSVVAALTLGACSSSEDTGTEATSAASSSAESSSSTAADELNAILAVATDPNAPIEEKVKTVQGSENAPELFETMTQAKVESGAQFQVVGSVLPGYDPTSEVLTTVMFQLPDRPEHQRQLAALPGLGLYLDHQHRCT